MGTTKSGRYMNTKGSGQSVSDFALVHSNEGDFVRKQNRVKGEMKITLRLGNGGHGQKGINLLDKYGIKYNIVKEYPNGVRVGNIPDHKQKSKREGISQSWFPKGWTMKDIKRSGEHVSSLKVNRGAPDGKKIYGVYKGVRVVVVRTHGKIATVFPDSNQLTAIKKRRKIMNNFDKFKLILQKRIETEDEDYIQIQKIWNEMVEVFSSDIEYANNFLMTECTADEFSTLSEVFDEIAEKTKSLEFIETLESLTLKFLEETEKYNILSFIDSAKLIVKNQ